MMMKTPQSIALVTTIMQGTKQSVQPFLAILMRKLKMITRAASIIYLEVKTERTFTCQKKSKT